jgi:hypothetical protein
LKLVIGLTVVGLLSLIGGVLAGWNEREQQRDANEKAFFKGEPEKAGGTPFWPEIK